MDLFLRLERGLDGKWAIVWSEVNEVGPKPLKPIKPSGPKFIPPSPFISAKPKSVWMPRQSPTLVNPAHFRSLKSDHDAQELGSQGQKPFEVPLPLERQEGASSRGDETTTMSVCGDPVTGKELESRCSSDIKFDASMAFSGFTSPGVEVTQGVGSRDSGLEMAGSEPMVLNKLYPLSDLGNGTEAKFGEGEADVEEVDSVGEYQSNSGLLILPWESSGVFDSGCGSGEKDNCVLDCEPLSQWVPNDLSVGLLVQDSVEERTQVTESGPPLVWVSKLMKKFCKMVGSLL